MHKSNAGLLIVLIGFQLHATCMFGRQSSYGSMLDGSLQNGLALDVTG
jgi:hypothetical protein